MSQSEEEDYITPIFPAGGGTEGEENLPNSQELDEFDIDTDIDEVDTNDDKQFDMIGGYLEAIPGTLTYTLSNFGNTLFSVYDLGYGGYSETKFDKYLSNKLFPRLPPLSRGRFVVFTEDNKDVIELTSLEDMKKYPKIFGQDMIRIPIFWLNVIGTKLSKLKLELDKKREESPAPEKEIEDLEIKYFYMAEFLNRYYFLIFLNIYAKNDFYVKENSYKTNHINPLYKKYVETVPTVLKKDPAALKQEFLELLKDLGIAIPFVSEGMFIFTNRENYEMLFEMMQDATLDKMKTKNTYFFDSVFDFLDETIRKLAGTPDITFDQKTCEKLKRVIDFSIDAKLIKKPLAITTKDIYDIYKRAQFARTNIEKCFAENPTIFPPEKYKLAPPEKLDCKAVKEIIDKNVSIKKQITNNEILKIIEKNPQYSQNFIRDCITGEVGKFWKFTGPVLPASEYGLAEKSSELIAAEAELAAAQADEQKICADSQAKSVVKKEAQKAVESAKPGEKEAAEAALKKATEEYEASLQACMNAQVKVASLQKKVGSLQTPAAASPTTPPPAGEDLSAQLKKQLDEKKIPKGSLNDEIIKTLMKADGKTAFTRADVEKCLKDKPDLFTGYSLAPAKTPPPAADECAQLLKELERLKVAKGPLTEEIIKTLMKADGKTAFTRADVERCLKDKPDLFTGYSLAPAAAATTPPPATEFSCEALKKELDEKFAATKNQLSDQEIQKIEVLQKIALADRKPKIQECFRTDAFPIEQYALQNEFQALNKLKKAETCEVVVEAIAEAPRLVRNDFAIASVSEADIQSIVAKFNLSNGEKAFKTREDFQACVSRWEEAGEGRKPTFKFEVASKDDCTKVENFLRSDAIKKLTPNKDGKFDIPLSIVQEFLATEEGSSLTAEAFRTCLARVGNGLYSVDEKQSDRVKKGGYTGINVPGDGWCFYHAVQLAAKLPLSMQGTVEFVTAIKDYINSNEALKKEAERNYRKYGSEPATFEGYLEGLDNYNSAYWAQGNAGIGKAAAFVLNANITFYTIDPDKTNPKSSEFYFQNARYEAQAKETAANASRGRPIEIKVYNPSMSHYYALFTKEELQTAHLEEMLKFQADLQFKDAGHGQPPGMYLLQKQMDLDEDGTLFSEDDRKRVADFYDARGKVNEAFVAFMRGEDTQKNYETAKTNTTLAIEIADGTKELKDAELEPLFEEMKRFQGLYTAFVAQITTELEGFDKFVEKENLNKEDAKRYKDQLQADKDLYERLLRDLNGEISTYETLTPDEKKLLLPQIVNIVQNMGQIFAGSAESNQLLNVYKEYLQKYETLKKQPGEAVPPPAENAPLDANAIEKEANAIAQEIKSLDDFFMTDNSKRFNELVPDNIVAEKKTRFRNLITDATGVKKMTLQTKIDEAKSGLASADSYDQLLGKAALIEANRQLEYMRDTIKQNQPLIDELKAIKAETEPYYKTLAALETVRATLETLKEAQTKQNAKSTLKASIDQVSVDEKIIRDFFASIKEGKNEKEEKEKERVAKQNAYKIAIETLPTRYEELIAYLVSVFKTDPTTKYKNLGAALETLSPGSTTKSSGSAAPASSSSTTLVVSSPSSSSSSSASKETSATQTKVNELQKEMTRLEETFMKMYNFVTSSEDGGFTSLTKEDLKGANVILETTPKRVKEDFEFTLGQLTQAKENVQEKINTFKEFNQKKNEESQKTKTYALENAEAIVADFRNTIEGGDKTIFKAIAELPAFQNYVKRFEKVQEASKPKKGGKRRARSSSRKQRSLRKTRKSGRGRNTRRKNRKA